MRIVGVMTVVETPEFLAASRKLLDDDERSLLVLRATSYRVREGYESCDGRCKVAANGVARGLSISSMVNDFLCFC